MKRTLTGVMACAAMTMAMAGPASGAAAVPSGARWIWYPEGNPASSAPAETRYFRGVVVVPPKAKVERARLMVTADDSSQIWLNGKKIARGGTGWNQFETLDVTRLLVAGRNVLAVAVTNSSVGPAGLVGWVDVRLADKKRLGAVTDANWKVANTARAGWTGAKFDDSAWVKAKVLGLVSMAPWGGRFESAAGVGLALDELRRGKGPMTADQARELIKADWLYQADGSPSADRALQEIAWARELAGRLTKMPKAPDLAAELAELTALEAKLKASAADTEATDLYLAVRRLKRRITFKNPLVNFDKLLLADTPAYAGVHESAHRNGYYYGNRSGSRLVVLDGLRPDAAERVLLPPETGYIMRMDLSYDARRVVFGMKPADERSFHLYEVGVDGSGLRQLTNSAYDDMDPIYLGDGDILFSTSRGNSYVRCLPQSASTVLARCDADGRDIRIISRNNEPDYTPSLLPDGRVLYTRWEYTERPLWRLQKLWTINPDGTGLSVYWGNASAHPDVIWEARSIPGTTKVMFVGVGHHNVITGCIGILDVTRGLEYPNGITKVTADVRWPESGDARGANPVTSPKYHAAGRFWSYRCPFPLGEEDFLVSAARKNNGTFDLFLMDIHGNRELIYAGLHNAWYARPLRPRAKPLARPDRVAWPKPGERAAGGVLFSSNVYQGVEGLPKGAAKFLRVIQMDAKTYSSGFKSWRHSGPVISVIQEDGVKRILGTVPIAPDGSVAFKVPSGQALHFQLLDEKQRCIQIMRSFTGVMPGETRGCLGCHGMHRVSPQARPNRPRLVNPPAGLTPPPWGAGVSISYERFCQPVLDKYCGKCHQGKGKGRKKLDLTLRAGLPERGVTDPKLLPFKEPYLTLIGAGAWSAPRPQGKGKAVGMAGCIAVERKHQYGPLKPMTMLSSTSPLIEWVTNGKHNKVKVRGEDLLRLIAWVDCNCVYRGDEEVRQLPDPPASVASRFPVPVKVRTAPIIKRLHAVNDPPPKTE